MDRVYLTCKTPGHLLFTMYFYSSAIWADQVGFQRTPEELLKLSRLERVTEEFHEMVRLQGNVIPLRRSPKISAGIPSDPQRNNKGP